MKKLILGLLLQAVSFLSFGQLTDSLSLSDKFYGLSTFWGECNYNFVYMSKVNKQEWDKAYKDAINEIVKTNNDYAYYRVLQKLCAILQDGHTQIYLPEHIESKIMISHFGPYRLFLQNVGGKVYVANVNKSKEKEIPVGSEVINVNGLPVQDYKATYVSPYVASSTKHNLENKAAYNLLSGVAGDEYDIQYKTPKGEIRSLKLRHAKTEEQELVVSFPQKDNFEFKLLEGRIAYVAIRTFEDASVVKDFEAVLPELRSAKAVIVDIRNNGGGSSRNALHIAKYFVEGDTIFGPRSYSREIIPADRAIGSFLTAQDTVNGKADWGLTKEETTNLFNAYSGNRFHAFPYNPVVLKSPVKLNLPVAILTNNYTASAAEDFLIYLDNKTHIKRVGEYTNGSTGQPLQINLPGGATAWICTKKVTKANDKEFVGIGIQPNVIVEQDLNSSLYPTQYDIQLETALFQLLNNN